MSVEYGFSTKIDNLNYILSCDYIYNVYQSLKCKYKKVLHIFEILWAVLEIIFLLIVHKNKKILYDSSDWIYKTMNFSHVFLQYSPKLPMQQINSFRFFFTFTCLLQLCNWCCLFNLFTIRWFETLISITH